MAITISEILTLSLDGYEFSANAHLFRWPGLLVVGTGEVPAPPIPDVWPVEVPRTGYAPTRTAKYPDRDRPNKQVPSLTTLEWRRQRKQPTEAPKYSPHLGEVIATIADPVPNANRPTVAAEFDQRQIEVWSKPVENPIAASLETFGTALAETEDDEDAFVIGGAWVLASLSHEILGVELLKPARVRQFGAFVATQIAWTHWTVNQPQESVEAQIKQFAQKDVAQMHGAAESRLHSIFQNTRQWHDAGMTPVLNVDGSINDVFTVANAATAVVAIRRLTDMAIATTGFRRGAQGVIDLLFEHFLQDD